MERKLSTEPYKGVRDFYPEDMALQRYIFDTWSRVAESYGFERYEASILEPAELYRAKTGEEIVSEQTYTFADRGDREVTLRPEMTPTVARMVARKRRELTFPLRWYSIPNLFRYERTQRGRLREHWQLNCDIFGSSSIAADVEIIALAHALLTAFGATEDAFTIKINDRALLDRACTDMGFDAAQARAMLRLLDRKDKIDTFEEEAAAIAGKPFDLSSLTPEADSSTTQIIAALAELGITNVVYDPSIVRGFDYYTGTVFELFDTNPANNRSMLGGGRYDDLTGLFGGDPIPGIGFGMGDVTMADFLKTHGLLDRMPDAYNQHATLLIAITDGSQALRAQQLAARIRDAGIRVSVDISERKVGDQIARAARAHVPYVLIFGDDEHTSRTYTLRRLADGTETTGSVEQIIAALAA